AAPGVEGTEEDQGPAGPTACRPAGRGVRGSAVRQTQGDSHMSAGDGGRTSRTVRPTPRPGVIRVALAASLLAALPGCIQHHDKVEIGLKRVSLDLAFKDLSKAKPPSVQQVLVSAPEPAAANLFAQLTPAQFQSSPTPVFGFAAPAACPAAAVGALPEQPASVFITKTPATGAYKQHNTGKFDLSGLLKLSGAYPPKSVLEISDVKATPNKDFAGNPDG